MAKLPLLALGREQRWVGQRNNLQDPCPPPNHCSDAKKKKEGLLMMKLEDSENEQGNLWMKIEMSPVRFFKETYKILNKEHEKAEGSKSVGVPFAAGS